MISQTETFLSASCSKKQLMPANVAASPMLDPLKDKDGDKVRGSQRQNVPTGVIVRVEQNKVHNWNLSSVIRELAQNLSDACIRTVNATSVTAMKWTAKGTKTGSQLYLNDKLAGEWFSYYEKDSSDSSSFSVNTFFYNRGCALVMDAFQPGSYKGTTSKYIAGGHGLGLKDLIGLLFQYEFETFTAVTYHPQGIQEEVEVVSSDSDNKQYFRRFELSRSKIVRDQGFSLFSGVYGMDVTDSAQSPKTTVPECIQKLLIQLSNEKSSPGTVFWLKKLYNNEDMAKNAVLEMKEASLSHIFLHGGADDNNPFKKLTVHDPHTQAESIILVYENTQKNVDIFLYPGLQFCSQVSETTIAEGRLGFILSPKLITTNRDRIQAYDSKLAYEVGNILIIQMQEEWRTHNVKWEKIVAARITSTKQFDQQKVIAIFKEVGMEITFLVLSHLNYDLTRSTQKLSTISDSIVSFCNDSRAPQERKQFLLDLMMKRIFGKFELVTLKKDKDIIDAIRDYKTSEKSSTYFPHFRPALLLTAQNTLMNLLVSNSFSSFQAIEQFFKYVVTVTKEWIPTNAYLKQTLDTVCDCASTPENAIAMDVSKKQQSNNRLKVYCVDVPIILFSGYYGILNNNNSVTEEIKELPLLKAIVISKNLAKKMEVDQKIAVQIFEKIVQSNPVYVRKSLQSQLAAAKVNQEKQEKEKKDKNFQSKNAQYSTKSKSITAPFTSSSSYSAPSYTPSIPSMEVNINKGVVSHYSNHCYDDDEEDGDFDDQQSEYDSHTKPIVVEKKVHCLRSRKSALIPDVEGNKVNTRQSSLTTAVSTPYVSSSKKRKAAVFNDDTVNTPMQSLQTHKTPATSVAIFTKTTAIKHANAAPQSLLINQMKESMKIMQSQIDFMEQMLTLAEDDDRQEILDLTIEID